MKKTLALTAVLPAIAAGWVVYQRYKARHELCCEFQGDFEPGQLVICEHSRAWRLGMPQYWEIGPLCFMRTLGWQEVTARTAMKMLGHELDEELAAFREASTEE